MPGSASEVAGKLLRALNATSVQIGSEAIRAAASVGISVFPTHATSTAVLVARADVAMYEAKAAGGNTWRVYSASPEQVRRAQEESQWERRIRRALEADQFLLFYQPMLQLADQRTYDYEALLRMEDSKGGLLGPGVFLQHAERHGLSIPIDRMVVRKAAHRIAALPADYGVLNLSLNLSARTLADPQLPTYIEDTLAQTRIDPARLGIEISETAIVEQLALAREVATSLQRLGCPLIVDDFGSAFASLRYLQPLGIKLIKLEAALTRGLATDAARFQLLKTLVTMAHDLGIKVAAKFVEDAAVLPLLGEIGLDYAQGFAIGRPIESLDAALLS